MPIIIAIREAEVGRIKVRDLHYLPGQIVPETPSPNNQRKMD
jgi:hypothetical protein